MSVFLYKDLCITKKARYYMADIGVMNVKNISLS